MEETDQLKTKLNSLPLGMVCCLLWGPGEDETEKMRKMTQNAAMQHTAENKFSECLNGEYIFGRGDIYSYNSAK